MAYLDMTKSSNQSNQVSTWLSRLSEAEKLWKDFRDEGKRIVKIYEAEDRKATPFNILYSNTETLSPALYSQTPRPVVGRRYKDKDPVGAAVSDVLTRTLEFLLDDGQSEYPDFDTLMKKAVTEALVPGCGLTRIKYDAEVSEPGEPASSSLSEEGMDEIAESFEKPAGKVEWETVCGVEVPWNMFICGYSTTWEKTPWIAFVHMMDEDELKENFETEVAAKVNLSPFIPNKDTGTENTSASSMTIKGACVYEIWDKRKKEVLFISEGYKEGLLKPAIPDPLSLSGFFPCPEPLKFFAKISSMVPTSLYTFYEEQAAELNNLTKRITRIIAAIKVRGFYDSSIQGMEALFQADDNKLLPADNCAALQSSGGLQNALWMVPVEKLAQVLQSLYVQREATKAIIYEIMGISDILRGSSRASETAAAQTIKSQWGSLRLRRMQKEVMRYSRDLLRLMVEVSVNKLSPETFKAMTGANYPTQAEKTQAEQLAQMAPDQAAQIAQSQPELLEHLSQPSWEDIFGAMTNSIQRTYKIDVETNSTIDADATEDKQSIAEFLGGFSQMMIALQPLVAQGVLPFEAAKSMMLAMIRRYNFGPQVEKELEQMKEPAPQQSPEMQAQAQEMAKKAEELAKKEQDLGKKEADINQAEAQLKASIDSAKASLDAQAKSNQMANDYATKELALQAEYNRKVSALDKQISDLESLSKPMSAPETV